MITAIKQLREDMNDGIIGIPASCGCVAVSPNTIAVMDNAIMNLDLLGGDIGTLQPLFDDLRSGKYQVTDGTCCMNMPETTVAALEAELRDATVDYPVPFFPSHWEPLPTAETGGDTILIGRYDTELYDRNDCTFKITTNSGDYTVDWGDGTTETITSGTVATHTYASGVYVVTVTGDLYVYAANFRSGAKNLYATGLIEQHYYGVGFAGTYHAYSNVKYYFEHDEIPQTSTYQQFFGIRGGIFAYATFDDTINATSMAREAGIVIFPIATFKNATTTSNFANSSSLYAPLATFGSTTNTELFGYYSNVMYIPSATLKSLENGRYSFYHVSSLSIQSIDLASLNNGERMFNTSTSTDHDTIVSILNSLPDVTTIDPDPQLDFRGTAGASQLTAAEIQVGTDKGWEVLT